MTTPAYILLTLGFLLYSYMIYKMFQKPKKDKIIKLNPLKMNNLPGFTRIEVIDHTTKESISTRRFVKYLKGGEKIQVSLQDDNKTIKIFIS
jgi:hypothetical protein